MDFSFLEQPGGGRVSFEIRRNCQHWIDVGVRSRVSGGFKYSGLRAPIWSLIKNAAIHRRPGLVMATKAEGEATVGLESRVPGLVISAQIS